MIISQNNIIKDLQAIEQKYRVKYLILLKRGDLKLNGELERSELKKKRKGNSEQRMKDATTRERVNRPKITKHRIFWAFQISSSHSLLVFFFYSFFSLSFSLFLSLQTTQQNKKQKTKNEIQNHLSLSLSISISPHTYIYSSVHLYIHIHICVIYFLYIYTEISPFLILSYFLPQLQHPLSDKPTYTYNRRNKIRFLRKGIREKLSFEF